MFISANQLADFVGREGGKLDIKVMHFQLRNLLVISLHLFMDAVPRADI